METNVKENHPESSVGQPLLETRFERYGVVVLIIVLGIGSMLMSSYHLSLLTTITIFSLSAMGLNLLSGNAGLISIAHAAFMGLGAFIAALFAIDLGIPVLIAILLAGGISAGVGLLFGIPSLRLSGLYLILATFAAQVILYWFFEQALWLTKSPDGRFAGVMTIAGFTFSDPWHYYILVLSFTIVGAVVYLNILRTGLGRSLEVIKERPIVSQMMGVNLTHTKLIAFTIGHFYAGVAGALYGWHLQFVATEAFDLMRSIELLVMIIIGGLGSLAGAVLGAIFIVAIPEILDLIGRNLVDDMAIMAPMRMFVFGFW
jgi:branched-chain amino acid transport system permease protein